jgi:uncharacterized SAM-binding protein YcdF (DUF218 family)
MAMKKKMKILIIVLVILTVLLLLGLFTNVYLLFLGPLKAGAEVDGNYGDVILVLGGGLRKGREIGYSTEERLLLAAELFNRKKRTVIISGGSMYRGSPAIKKITDFLVRHGVDKEYIRFEGKSQTTFDNFVYTRKMIEEMKSKEIIVCTSPYHQWRARMILDYLGVENFRIAKMERSEVYQAHSVKQRLRNMKLVFREYLAILKFKIFKK